MPKANDGRIAGSLLKATDIGPVNTDEISKFGLRYPGRQPEPLYIATYQLPHVS